MFNVSHKDEVMMLKQTYDHDNGINYTTRLTITNKWITQKT